MDMDVLALHLLRGTQEAALACIGWVGRGDSDAADGAAVEAMRSTFDTLPARGTVVIGEGEKDEAPMLFLGEEVGNEDGPGVDLAVDPLENTSACAENAEGAIAVVAAAPEGKLWHTPGWYMDKFVVGREGAGSIDITAPVEENLRSLAKALGKSVEDLTTVVLDKPRHEELIERIYATGAKITLIPEGDVAGSLRVLLPNSEADALIGIGGSPEGVITACAVRLLGGDMQGRLAPQKEGEEEKLAEAGQEPGEVLTLDDLVPTDQCCFVATSITAGRLLRGPVRTGSGWRTQSYVSSPGHRRLIVDEVHTDSNGAESPEGGSHG